MKTAVNLLIAGCLVSALAFTSRQPGSGQYSGIVEASPAFAMITGSVRDEHGLPLAGALVSLLESQPRGKEIRSIKTDNKGRFSVNIVPGIYRIRAAAEGFASMLTRVNLDRPVRVTYDFALRRTDTLVDKRGDSDDYRWVARSVPRHVLNLREDSTGDTVPVNESLSARLENRLNSPKPTFHGMAQFIASSSNGPGGSSSGSDSYGANFAVSGTFGNNLEMALIGQRGAGFIAPQRFSAIASMRPSDRHQVTAIFGYGQIAFGGRNPDPTATANARLTTFAGNDNKSVNPLGQVSLDQVSVSATGSWQAFQPLLVIYGFDYSRFISPNFRQSDSFLPRFAVQYSPTARTRINAGITTAVNQRQQSLESFNTENIQAGFETTTPEIAFTDRPVHDRSRRYETGIEKIFGNGESSIEASAFYDIVSGHGVGILALPLEASPDTQMAFQQVAHQIIAMNGAARGARLMYKRSLGDHLSASVGVSLGRGSKFNSGSHDMLTPARMFRGGYFQVATAKIDLDFTHETGTHISTVIRFSPSAVVFAIDPFAGRMSVYDPNINIYVTQDLPNFGLPVRWQALVDIRNLLDQTRGAEDGLNQILAASSRRSLRGGVAFRW
ncbi:MAG: TonB-dependent receptor [Acidobacteria bacterium]|nr:TonB-dependent receptor [Acidobacteriota bacterium]